MKAKCTLFTIVLLATSMSVAQQWNNAQQGVKWRTFQSGTKSAIKSFQTSVMMTEGDFQRYWARSTGDLGGASRAPKGINWNKECVVAIHLGTRTTAGASVYVESITAPRPHQVVVTYVEQIPYGRRPHHSDKKPPKPVETSPYVIAVMDRTSGIPTFVRREASARQTYYPPTGYYDYYYPYPIPYQVYRFGDWSGYTSSQTLVITTSVEWTRYWQTFSGPTNVASSVPDDIDWSKEYLVAIHLGRRASAGYSVYVDGVNLTKANDLVISYGEKTPRPEELQAQRITSPYTILRLPRGTPPPRFQRLPGVPLVKSNR